MKPALRTAGLLIVGILAGGMAAAAFHLLPRTPRPSVPTPPVPQTASAPAVIPASALTPAIPVPPPRPVEPPAPRAAAHPLPQRAVVLGATPVTETVQTSRTECAEVAVERQAPVQDTHRIAGTVIGGALGGALGHQVGGGRGKDVATALGAVAGGLAGNHVQARMQQKDTYADTERRCVEVPVETAKIVGYDVQYRYAGRTATVRMRHDPGSTLPMRNGQPVID